jgi:hypothetical protein
MRWNNAKIGPYEIVPIKEQVSLTTIKKQYLLENPYSRLLVLQGKNEKSDYPQGVQIGQTISVIMSFVMRCSVVSYDKGFPVLRKDRIPSKEALSLPANIWVEDWKNMLGLGIGGHSLQTLRKNFSSCIPTPREEQYLIENMNQIYETLIKVDEERYYSIIGAMRLYQLALNSARLDLNLAYSLLVAAVEAASGSYKPKVKLKEIDPKGKLAKTMSKLNFDNQLQEAVSRLVVYEEGLKTRFCNFILDNLPTAFWEGDYSMVNELESYSESLDELYHRGAFLRDIAEKVPEPQKQELLRMADEQEKRYEGSLQQHPKRKGSTWFFDHKRRKWVMHYMQVHLSRVLRNTYDGRSGVLHRGRSFPKTGLEEGIRDWIPDVFEEDFSEFRKGHLFIVCSTRWMQKAR